MTLLRRAEALIDAGKKATPGPIIAVAGHYETNQEHMPDEGQWVVIETGTGRGNYSWSKATVDDLAFFALSRNDAPAIAEGLLLAEQFAKDILAGFENPDVSHLNFRVTAAKLATDFLAALKTADTPAPGAAK